jgi:hypothetical protein
MRAPPAVAVETAPTRALRATQSLLFAAAAAALAAWVAQRLGFWRGAAGAGAGAAVLGAAVGWRLRTSAPARVAWTGAAWEMATGPAGGGGTPIPPPEVAVDLGRWMLLRLRPPGHRPLWVEATERGAGDAWPAWRAAVYSRAVPSSPRSPEDRPPS